MKLKNPKSEPDPPMDAESLRQAMIDAFAALQLAQLKHEHLMGIAADAGILTDDGKNSARQNGLEYAHALAEYSDATMAWLAFADTLPHPDGVQYIHNVAREQRAAGDELLKAVWREVEFMARGVAPDAKE
jgi:hypothetical protein